MPILGGIESTALIRELSSEELPRQPYIVALTAAVLGEDDMLTEQGMNYYLSKPVLPKLLAKCLELAADYHQNQSSKPTRAQV